MKPYNVDHKKWQAFPSDMQMKNIAAEFMRASNAGLVEDRETEEQKKGAYERAIVLIDATIADPKNKDKRKLYELRDATTELCANSGDSAVSKYIYSQLLNL